MKNVVLNNGIEMPWIGLGTYPMRGEECQNAVESAAAAGYMLFDTSAIYRNAEAIGTAFKNSFLRREDYFLMTKISNRLQETRNVRAALTDTLHFLRLDYVDMYLLHWPNPGTYIECYQQMEELQKEGLTRAIGVSNFHEHHLEKLFQYSSIVPAVNQVELHPLLSQEKLANFCTQRGITMISYSPFARMHEKLMEHPVLLALAEKYGVKVTQIIVRWNYQHGYIVIPKSANPVRQRENIFVDTFELTETEMRDIDACNEDFRVRYNPDTCDFTKL